MATNRTISFADDLFELILKEAEDTNTTVNKIVNDYLRKSLMQSTQEPTELKEVGIAIKNLVDTYKNYKATLQ